MTGAAVLWTAALGIAILAIGWFTHRNEVVAREPGDPLGLVALGPVFVAASIAAFAGEHFGAGPVLAQLVPTFMPARLFIAYLVGVAHLAAAVSLVAKRFVRWSSLGLALMFTLFVLLMDLPSAIASPSTRMFWILAAREGTFAIGGLALFASAIAADRPELAGTVATIATVWTGAVLVVFGIQNVLFPQYSPGVPSTTPTPGWVPVPTAIAYVTGVLFIACGLAMFARRFATVAAARCGMFVVLLTLAIYVTQFVIARGVQEQITALNFIFDTLLFGGTVLVVAKAIRVTRPVTP